MLTKGRYPTSLLYGNIVYYDNIEMLLCCDNYVEYNINRLSLPHTPPLSENIIRSEELEIFGVSYQRAEVPLNPSSYCISDYSQEGHVIFECQIPSHKLTLNICCGVTSDIPITPKVCLIDQEGVGSYHIYVSPSDAPIPDYNGEELARCCLIQYNTETGRFKYEEICMKFPL